MNKEQNENKVHKNFKQNKEHKQNKEYKEHKNYKENKPNKQHKQNKPSNKSDLKENRQHHNSNQYKQINEKTDKNFEIEIVGIRFKPVGKIYYFSPNGITLKKGDFAIVETIRGIEFGEVMLNNRLINSSELPTAVKPIIRRATSEDIKKNQKNINDIPEAIKICEDSISLHNLDMKIIEAEYTFDRSKVLFYFISENRVDFRDLVKDLASIFKMRIELRQIGVRDEAKVLNGIGICGRNLCCATFLGSFQPVTIKMAKDQSLSLNPTKISGVCGRLMCCLKYEEDTYKKLNNENPIIGDIVKTEFGTGEVINVYTLRQRVKVLISQKQQENTIHELSIHDITIVKQKHKRPEQIELDDELKGLLD